MTQKQYKAPALEKGVAIIELLSETGTPMTMVEIGAALDRSKHEIYRMLVSLEGLGWLARTSDEKFFLTNRLFDIAMATPPQRNLHESALPVMRALAVDTGQSCHLAVASGSDIVIVARMESPGLIGFSVRLGHRLSFPLSTSGLAIWYHSDEESRAELARNFKDIEASAEALKSLTKASEDHLSDGLIERNSALVPGIIDMSVPILEDASSRVIAALTIPFLTSTNKASNLGAVRSSLKEAGRQI